jgi:hypothetical protein
MLERTREKYGRRLGAALLLSLLLHVLFAFVLPALPTVPFAPKPEPTPPEIVRLDRLKVTRQTPVRHTPRHVARAAPVAPVHVSHEVATIPLPAPPRAILQTVPLAPVPQRHELAKAAPHAPAQPPAARVAYAKPEPPAEHPAARGRPHLTDQTLAHVEDDLGAAIREDRSGIDPLDVPHAAATPGPKHFGPDYGPLELGGHGLCDPIKDWTDAGYDYYFVACNMHLDDGSVERQPVPWPIRFPPSADPFLGTLQHDVPLPLPLPGWHLPSGEYVSDQLRQYANDHGAAL